MATHFYYYLGRHLAPLALACCALTAPALALAQAPAAVPAPTPTTSVEEANAKLAEVASGRAAVEARFAEGERECYTRFFVNNCLDKIKETRRTALAQLRAVEVEASHFKRADAVDKRDRALVDSDVKYTAKAAVREASPRVPHVEHAPAPAPRTGGKDLAQKQAEHDARVQKQAVRDAAQAGKRAEKAAAFERKQQVAAERQRAVAAKLAEKQAERERKAAAAEKK